MAAAPRQVLQLKAFLSVLRDNSNLAGLNSGGGGGNKIKSLKKRKKKIFEDLTILVVLKGKMQLLQYTLTLLKPKTYCFIALGGRISKIL